MRRLTYSLFVLLLSLCCSCQDNDAESLAYIESGVPSYCVKNVREQVERLQQLSQTGVADMLYITDTHYADNTLDSPGILSFFAHKGLTRRVVWGGDAISAYGEIQTEWDHHQRDFLGSVAPYVSYYMVRGNHEYTAIDKTQNRSSTYPQLQTASLLRAHLETDVVRPADDPEACYYYFDDPEQHLRYCVFDTTDSIDSSSKYWNTLPHTSQRQLDWMDHHALHNVPMGFSLVIVTHIGITPETYAPHAPFEPLLQLVQHAGAPVLMVLSGHRHQDFQTYRQGILHVLTGPDALYPDLHNSPFLHDIVRKSKTSTAPLMDLFSFSDDRKTIHALRVGAGYSRTFHLDALSLSLTSRQPLPQLTSFDSGQKVSWTAYDATGYDCIDDVWEPPCTILRITPDGSLQPLQLGEAVLMATSHDGRREFFNVKVR